MSDREREERERERERVRKRERERERESWLNMTELEASGSPILPGPPASTIPDSEGESFDFVLPVKVTHHPIRLNS